MGLVRSPSSTKQELSFQQLLELRIPASQFALLLVYETGRADRSSFSFPLRNL
jgi:hypothetical protein